MKIKSRSFKNRLAGSSALVAAALLTMSAPAPADAAQVLVSGTGNSTQTLVAGDELIVQNGASIVDTPGVIVDNVAATSIYNGGIAIEGETNLAINMVNTASLSGSLTNLGIIAVDVDDTTDASITTILLPLQRF